MTEGAATTAAAPAPFLLLQPGQARAHTTPVSATSCFLMLTDFTTNHVHIAAQHFWHWPEQEALQHHLVIPLYSLAHLPRAAATGEKEEPTGSTDLMAFFGLSRLYAFSQSKFVPEPYLRGLAGDTTLRRCASVDIICACFEGGLPTLVTRTTTPSQAVPAWSRPILHSSLPVIYLPARDGQFRFKAC